VGPLPRRTMPQRHGRARYKDGCRCEICRAANAERTARYRHTHRAAIKAVRRQDQTETAQQAHRLGYVWTGPELELAMRSDLTVKQIALMIGRTYSAVSRMREKLRRDVKIRRVVGLEPMR